MLRRVAFFVASLATVGCARGCEGEATISETPPASADPVASTAAEAGLSWCPRFRTPRTLGRVEVARIEETSGVVASRKHPGVLWLHNDSGHAEQLFAVTTAGRALGTYSLSGAECIDWEDMAIGAAPGNGWYLYVGDTGTNQAERDKVVVYRVLEPDVRLDQSPREAVLDGVESFELTYPDGKSHDSETLMLDPWTGDLFVVTKTTSGESGVYRATAPHVRGSERGLELVATFATAVDAGRGSERTTGGDISPDGKYIIVKTYTTAYLWKREQGTSVATALSTPPCEVPVAVEQQGEAIGFSADGMGYFTVSEGTSQPIYFFERRE